MPIYIVHDHLRAEEWKKVREAGSPLLVNCLESIDASLWLIAGWRVPQALVLLLNSIEVAFKAELERIHPVLIADTRRLDYSGLKSVLRDAFLAHPRGQQMVIKEFDMERTITFVEALDRTKELYPLLQTWRSRLLELQSLRNNVTHYGSKETQIGQYVNGIATCAFPFLREFLSESSGVLLENLITPPVSRELEIAREVCERLSREAKDCARYALYTVRQKMLYTYVEWPEPIDEEGWVQVDFDTQFEMAEQMRKEIGREWDDSYIEKSCHICDSISLFVKVEPLTPRERSLRVTAARCPQCGLDIREDEEYLAEYHLGELTTEETEKFLAGIDE